MPLVQRDSIELSDSDSDSKIPRPVKQGSAEISVLRAELTAKSNLVAEQGKELNKLRKENERCKNERDLQNTEIASLQDELKNILQQLDDHTVRV